MSNQVTKTCQPCAGTGKVSILVGPKPHQEVVVCGVCDGTGKLTGRIPASEPAQTGTFEDTLNSCARQITAEIGVAGMTGDRGPLFATVDSIKNQLTAAHEDDKQAYARQVLVQLRDNSCEAHSEDHISAAIASNGGEK